MLGILCGLHMEARIARKVVGAKIAVSAARPEKAKAEAEALIAAGATRLLSFGLAGGLDPSLPAGTLMVGEGVQSSNGLWPADQLWTEELKAAFPEAVTGLVWGSERILDASSVKQSVYARFQARVVDTESQYVAAVAAKAGIPFAIVRAVSDVATLDLPSVATVPLNEDGRICLPAILMKTLREPSQIPSLIRLGQDNKKGLRALSHASLSLVGM